MQRITLYVPETFNDGLPVPEKLLDSFEDELLDIALRAKETYGVGDEGATRIDHARGVFRMTSGKKQRDGICLLELIAVDEESVRDEVGSLCDRIRIELQQEAVLMTFAPVEVTLTTGLVPA